MDNKTYGSHYSSDSGTGHIGAAIVSIRYSVTMRDWYSRNITDNDWLSSVCVSPTTTYSHSFLFGIWDLVLLAAVWCWTTDLDVIEPLCQQYCDNIILRYIWLRIVMNVSTNMNATASSSVYACTCVCSMHCNTTPIVLWSVYWITAFFFRKRFLEQRLFPMWSKQ